MRHRKPWTGVLALRKLQNKKQCSISEKYITKYVQYVVENHKKSESNLAFYEDREYLANITVKADSLHEDCFSSLTGCR